MNYNPRFIMRLLAPLFFAMASCSETPITPELKILSPLSKAFAQGDFFEATKDLSFVVFNDSVHYISTDPKGFNDNRFMFHLLNNDNTFKNFDFSATGKARSKKLAKTGHKVFLMSQALDLKSHEGFRTGQFSRDSLGNPINIWVKQISKKELGRGKHPYLSILDDYLGFSFLEEEFIKDLNQGTFYENPFGFYVLLTQNHIYLITTPKTTLEAPIMLHFVKEDYTFTNSSFNFSNHSIDTYLNGKFKDFRIAKVILPKINYSKIRFGQYTEKENIWVQEVWPKELWHNPLLKYNGELTR
ncbi:hypothetical protein [Flagellimonas sp. 2504JD1-5]